MALLDDIQHGIAPELQRLNECMNDTLSTSNRMMNEIVANYLKTKGKQIRPIMVLLSAKLFQPINDNTVAAAAAIEMLHNASLIHDDVVDDTMTRRNRPTVNAIWDNHVAVLVGDYFVSSSLFVAQTTGDIRIIRTMAELGRMLSLGEIDQINNARFHDITEQSYIEIISQKTASLFEACVMLGGYSVNAEDESIQVLRRFAHLLGLCFQIKDDIFDYFEDANIGKPTGNDLREGKVTLPLIYALSRNDVPEHEVMSRLVKKDELLEDEIVALIDFAKRSGGIDYAYGMMERYHDEAVRLLDRFDNEEVKRLLIDIFDYIITRKY